MGGTSKIIVVNKVRVITAIFSQFGNNQINLMFYKYRINLYTYISLPFLLFIYMLVLYKFAKKTGCLLSFGCFEGKILCCASAVFAVIRDTVAGSDSVINMISLLTLI